MVEKFAIEGNDGQMYALKLVYDNETDCILGTLASKGGERRFIRVEMAPIRSAAKTMLSNRVGWSWSQIKQAAKSVAKKVSSKQVWGKVNDILNDPRFAKGMSMASSFVPGLGLTYGAVRAATDLVVKVRAGDPAAIAKANEVIMEAQAGNPTAQKAADMLARLYEASKSGVDISGWALNLGHQSPVAHSLDYLQSPFAKLRYLYGLGLSNEKPTPIPTPAKATPNPVVEAENQYR